MKHVHVGHDAMIGGLRAAPGVVVCGHATIGHGVKIGVNACVLPFVTVGRWGADRRWCGCDEGRSGG
jgi:acetyltransferase-like isoleucine patch superfamily enzyme